MLKRLRLAAATLMMLLTMGTVAVPAVSAVDVFGVCSGTAAETDVCKDKASQNSGTNPVIHALKVTISIMSFVIGVTAIIMLIVSGISMSSSGGDPQKVAEARRSVIYALIGLAVAALAETIVVFVLTKL